MSVANDTSAIVYTGNGSATYAIPFPFLDPGHIKATVEPLTLLGYVLHRGELSVAVADLTEYQFGLDLASDVELPAIGSVFRVKKLSGTFTRRYEIVALDVVAGFHIVTANSTDAATFSGGDMAAGDEDQVYLATEPAQLDAEAYTVTRLADGSGGTLTPAASISTDATITIWRDVPFTQPTEFQFAGPFPSRSAETALDRVVMQIQQVNRRLDQHTGENNGILIPPPGSTNTQDVLTWGNTSARAAVTAARAGQLGVQLDSGDVYEARSKGPGDWFRVGGGRWEKEWCVFRSGEEIAPATARFVAALAEETTVGKMFAYTHVPVTGDSVDLTLRVGTREIGAISLGIGEQFASIDSEVPDLVFPAGTVLLLDLTTSTYPGGNNKGLTIGLLADHRGTVPYSEAP
jgi:hypothetical protein